MKILVTQDTFAPSMDGPVFLAANTLAELETDSARGAVVAGRALYIDAKDDPTTRGTQAGRWTAPEPLVDAARQALKKKPKAADPASGDA